MVLHVCNILLARKATWTMICMHDLFYFIGDPGPLFISFIDLFI